MKTIKDIPAITEEEKQKGIEEFIQGAKDEQMNVIDNKNNNDNVNNNKNNNEIVNKNVNKIIIKKANKKVKQKKKDTHSLYACHLPNEYIEALTVLKSETTFYKDELVEEAFELLFKKYGVEFIKE